jgi:dUTP pyrophosphatase
MQKIELQILDHRIGNEFKFPQYETAGSAGIDLCACIDRELVIKPNESILINTGLAIFIKDPSICSTIIPRSGLGHKYGIVLGNLIGLIDSDYQGPLMISCWNRGINPFTLRPGDRLAQLVFLPVLRPQFQIVDSFEKTERAASGFGSTGISSNSHSTPRATGAILHGKSQKDPLTDEA